MGLEEAAIFEPRVYSVPKLKEGEILLVFDIDGTLYWENQSPPELTQKVVLNTPEDERGQRWPSQYPPTGWYSQQRSNIINYISAVTGLTKAGAIELQHEMFKKHNQSLRGLLNEHIIEDSMPSRARFWDAIHFGDGTESEGPTSKFTDWITPDRMVQTWLRSLPNHFRKIILTNASEAIGMKRIEALGLCPKKDFELVLGSEFMDLDVKPQYRAFERVCDLMGVSYLTKSNPSNCSSITAIAQSPPPHAVSHGLIDVQSPSELSDASKHVTERGIAVPLHPTYIYEDHPETALNHAVRCCDQNRWSHPVVMFEDNFRNVRACTELGIGVVRIRNPDHKPEAILAGQWKEKCEKYPDYSHSDPREPLHCTADVVVNKLSDLNWRLPI